MPATFRGASAGSSASGGVSEDRIVELADAAVARTTVTPFVEADYAWKAPIHWAQIDGSKVGRGVVSRVEIPCLTREGEPELSSGELFLELYEADEAGRFGLLAVSRNAVKQQVGQVSRWEFDDVEVHGRTIRLSPTRHAGGGWDESLVLGAGGRPRYDLEDSFVELAVGGRSAVMLAVTISTVTRAERFASAEHAADGVCHIAAGERGRWNAKADASALAAKVNSATFNAHTGDTVKHVTADERDRWNETADFFTRETQTGNISQTVAETLTLTVRSNIWGKEPSVHVRWDSAGAAEYGSEHLAYTPVHGEKMSIALSELIAHPGDGGVHLGVSERADLMELLAHKDALLALLGQPV